MRTTTDHLIVSEGGVSLAGALKDAEGADAKSMPVSANGLSAEPLEELTALAVEKTAEGGLLLEPAQHLMQAALEAEIDQHLAAEAGRGGRVRVAFGRQHPQRLPGEEGDDRGRPGHNAGPDRPGTFSPRLLAKYARRTGALDVLSGSNGLPSAAS
ncbi:hypothetical protein [Streptomyces sp. NBC_00091]|uniref:hypothetical protein n=1 Tax=Streptomyces sp. NBC_00091 TaxID=2975648 RepID=UPI00225376E6|nr:hypothetical protein [Streptomyces sp. NBC_00091]MCX5374915.1 hypothetical protein [Streptomyces sp. NBC_00091]MCX5380252.1 hypothetical protein [Streptomyces sp. NBC_00091]